MRLLLFFALIMIISCSAFDIASSSQAYSYPKPVIEKISLDNNSLQVIISINLNPTDRNDFKKYVILSGEVTDNLSQGVESVNLNDTALTKTSQIPFYLTETAKPVFNGTQVNSLTHTIDLDDYPDRFNVSKSYKIVVLAWGLNDTFATSFNNNGWIYSPLSLEKSFNFRKNKEIILSAFDKTDNQYGFSLKSGAIVFDNQVLTDIKDSDHQISFKITNVNNSGTDSVMMGLWKVGSGSAIQPLGASSSFFDIIDLPDTGYLSGVDELPIQMKNLYSLKNSDNTYVKIYVDTIDLTGSHPTINIKIAYSGVANEKKL